MIKSRIKYFVKIVINESAVYSWQSTVGSLQSAMGSQLNKSKV